MISNLKRVFVPILARYTSIHTNIARPTSIVTLALATLPFFIHIYKRLK